MAEARKLPERSRELFLAYVASSCRRPITRLQLADLSAQRVRGFLNTMETTRGNRVSTRNQRLAALHTFYRFLALRQPEMLAEAQQVEATPSNGLRRLRHYTWNTTKSRPSSGPCRAMESSHCVTGLSSWCSITPERERRKWPI